MACTVGAAAASANAEPVPEAPFLVRPQMFGAKGDGKTLDTKALNAAIEKVHLNGGGTVYLSPGAYLCGTVILRSKVSLFLEAGAVLLGSTNIADYTPQPGPGLEDDAGQRHLLFARDAEDITISGPGLINGQGPSFWEPTHRGPVPEQDQWKDVATFDYKPKQRVSPMLEFVHCTRVRVEQVHIENSAGWTMRLINCDSAVIEGINIKNPIIGPNVDGIDVSNSSNIRIANCMIDTADDAICLKSEVRNPYSPDNIVTRNITVTNCILSSCCNGFKFGTAGHGGFENIVFSNSVIFNDEVNYPERVISGIAIEVVDGGWAEGVVITGVRMQRTRTPIFIRLGNRTPGTDGKPGRIRGLMLSDIHAEKAILTSSITGIPGFPVEEVTLSNIRIQTDEAGKAEWSERSIPEESAAYPEARMFGRLPAYGLYVRHAKAIRLRNLSLGGSTKEERPALWFDDAIEIEVDGLRLAHRTDRAPAIVLSQTHSAWIRASRGHDGASSLVHLQGPNNRDILLSGNDLRKASRAVSADVPDALKEVTIAASNIFPTP